ncbi:MAG TPA: hypothetical protein VGN00_12695 [Puia sp.]
MKTLTKSSFLLLSGFLVSGSLWAQTADEVVSKYIDAIGGSKVVSGITSIVLESNVSVMGSDVASTTHILNGKGFKSETDFNGSKIVKCITDKGGWDINPMAGQSTATAMSEDQAKAGKGSFQVGGPLFDYAKKGYKVEMTGTDGADLKLKLSGEGMNMTYYINSTTYLLDKMVTMVNVHGQDMELTTAFRDYKKTDIGFTMPYTQEITNPQFSLTITHTKVEFNKPIDPAIFEMPK